LYVPALNILMLVEEATCVHELALNNCNVSGVNQLIMCNSCLKYKDELEIVVQELKTAKKIIQLLQDDLNASKDCIPVEAIISTINKSSSECVKAKEESASTMKWLDIVARRKVNQSNSKELKFHEISTIVNGQVVSKVNVKRLSPNQSTSRTCKISATQFRSKDRKIIIVGDSHAQGCTARIKDYFSENVEVMGYVKPGVTTDILVKTASNDIINLTKKEAIILWGG
jgi:hypothetical protein